MPAPIGIPVGLAIARAVAGIVGKGAKNVSPVYRNMNTGSVKVVNPTTVFKKDLVNSVRTSIAKQVKSGDFAKDSAAMKERNNLKGILSGKTGNPKIIKIKSGK